MANGGLVELMSVGEEDVQRWFDVVLQWGSADTSEKCRDTFECLDELQVFLKQLENALGGLVCINPAETQLATPFRSIYREAFVLWKKPRCKETSL